MKKYHKFPVTVCLLSLALVSFLAETAHAYLDPGTGSYILQLLIAGLLGALFTVKLFWKQIRDTFKKTFSKKGE